VSAAAMGAAATNQQPITKQQQEQLKGSLFQQEQLKVAYLILPRLGTGLQQQSTGGAASPGTNSKLPKQSYRQPLCDARSWGCLLATVLSALYCRGLYGCSRVACGPTPVWLRALHKFLLTPQLHVCRTVLCLGLSPRP
jgi:hypothetical protein